MRPLLLAVGLVTMPAMAGPYVEIGLGINGLNPANDWDDCNTAGANLGAGYMWHLDDNWIVDLGYQHYSQYLCGPPLDDQGESNLDSINITLRYEW